MDIRPSRPLESSDLAGAEFQTQIEVTRFDREKHQVAGKTENGTEIVFQFRNLTRVEIPRLGNASFTLGALWETDSKAVPVRAGQKIQVAWRLNKSGETRVATKLTLP